MNYKPKKTTCACGSPERQRNGLCRACHAKCQRKYRAEVKAMRGEGSGLLADALRQTKRVVLLDAIRAEGGNFTAASIRLGIHRNSVERILRELGISTPELREYLRVQRMEAR